MSRAQSTSSNTDRLLDVVGRTWGFASLRPQQAEAIEAALTGRDSLVVMPTGGGKSLCYQAPPLVNDTLTVVVSPLISLMKDQVDALKLNGYPAAGLHSGCTSDEVRASMAACERGELRLLFVAPERLLGDGFLDWLASVRQPSGAIGVNAFAIDEAHCISHWGHDFRPEYRRLASLRTRFPGVAMHAFTATATPRVREDIVSQLGLKNPAVLIGTFDRPNLVYRIVPRVTRDAQALEVIRRHSNEAVIVYCISRKDTEQLAAVLSGSGVKAAAYHAGLDAARRRKVQEAFTRERLDVVVATVAFGMGIDRSNVRCVLHAAMPKSIEAYQQETGRAGRDGLDAECVMLYSSADAQRWTELIFKSAEEASADPGIVKAQLELLDQMHRLCAAMSCRHKSLSEHFGQGYPFPNCNACDVCLNEVDATPEADVMAQKIISAVARVMQKSGMAFGAAHIVDVLRGSRAAKIHDRGHHELSVFGLLPTVPRNTLLSYMHQLVDQGVLTRGGGEFPTITLNAASRDVLRGQHSVKLFDPRQPAATRGKRPGLVLNAEEAALFESLRTLRRELADARNVPPYVVFADTTLQELAVARPGSLERMMSVRGVGTRKIEDFGETFLSHIRQWCATHGMQLDAASGGRRLAPPQSERRTIAAQLFAKGESIEGVARTLALSPKTIAEYLGRWVEETRPTDISAWVSADVESKVTQAAEEIGTEWLKPIHDALGGEVPYEDIRLVVAKVRSRQG